MDEITFIESDNLPGMYAAYDHHGNACGWVGKETMDNHLAYLARKSEASSNE